MNFKIFIRGKYKAWLSNDFFICLCLGICDRVERLCSLSDNFKRIHQIFFIHPDNILSLSS